MHKAFLACHWAPVSLKPASPTELYHVTGLPNKRMFTCEESDIDDGPFKYKHRAPASPGDGIVQQVAANIRKIDQSVASSSKLCQH